ncbi:MFS transporter [Streptomyces sp. KLOTTS4A1]|uniref:MFS transporter n=1 Tax=Streptomyces sp. KLOTTS4A1 TaxID=3390996 RepID=UPI0039F5BB76
MGNDRGPLVSVLAANTVSAAGTAMSLLAVPWFVLATTGSAARAGLVAFCEGVPMVVASLLSGPLLDRFGRRRVSIGADSIAATAIGLVPLLHLTGLLRFWMLCLLVAVVGLCVSPGDTSRSVLTPHLAERAGVTVARTASYLESARQLARLLGAPLAGLLIAVLGPAMVLFIDAATFLLSAVLIAAGLRGLPAAAPQKDTPRLGLRRYRADLREGFAFVRRTRLLLAIVLMIMMTNALNNGWNAVMLPVHVRENLGSPAALGLVSGISGAAALTGALLYGHIAHRFRRWPVYTVVFLICGAPRLVVPALFPDLASLIVITVIAGLAAGALNPLLAPVVYETVPEQLRSRVQGFTTAGVLGAIPLGVLGSGLLTDTAGLTAALLILGGVYLVVTLCPAFFPVWRQMDAEPKQQDRPADTPAPV